ncbi:MAG TPA: 4-(cytidine 5'-diphospho)-2-C-methyl-D-erythritol kinase [Nocardioidaceae bacterium]|nr:4-(cytidine 5'-diphospho)-2-C-methyl-D-erythritol kinase [Nocardioidaceae bacterium]
MSGRVRGQVSAVAPAKVNLCLGVGPVRADGFHPLATIYQAVGLQDRVTVGAADEVSVTVRGDARSAVHEVPTDGSNLAVQAALVLAKHHGLDRGVRIVIEKGIPVAGGMAGGSADAAATLVACDRLWRLGTSREKLLSLAAELGSDVPFALVGGTALGSGRGELVTPLTTRGRYWWVVLESAVGLSTPAVYREFDALHTGSALVEPQISSGVVSALRDDDVVALGAALTNELQPAALRLRPELEGVLELGRTEGVHGAIVSGSGPSCLFLCADRADAVRVGEGLRSRGLGPVSVAPGPVAGARVVAAREG